jgi:hypothetical protein
MTGGFHLHEDLRDFALRIDDKGVFKPSTWRPDTPLLIRKYQIPCHLRLKAA